MFNFEKTKELKQKYLKMLEKKENGEELGFDEEVVLTEIIALNQNCFYGEKSAIERFFSALDLIIKEEEKTESNKNV
jgi:hypothetical protein